MTPHGLAGALARIVNEAECVDVPAIQLVVPAHAHGAGAPITGREPVASPLRDQRLVMLDARVANARKAEEPL